MYHVAHAPATLLEQVRGPSALEAQHGKAQLERERQRKAILAVAGHKARLLMKVHRTRMRAEIRALSHAPRQSAPVVSKRSGGRREHRPGHRRTIASSRAGPGDDPGSEPGEAEPSSDGLELADDEAAVIARKSLGEAGYLLR